MVIKHNLTASNSNRMFGLTSASLAKSTEKLSSGYRINRAADDAAGLSISEKMRRQIRGLTQASLNSQDGISMVQTAEGGLNEVHDMLQRANELAVKSANGTNTAQDRSYIDEEFQHLKKEINRIADTSTFNEIQLFPSDGSSEASNLNVSYNFADGVVTVTDAQTYNSYVASAAGGTSQIADMIANGFIPNATKAILSTFPALDIGEGSFTIPLTIASDAPGGVLASAGYSYTVGTFNLVGLSMNVDSADFVDSNALTAADPKYNLLLSTINHEVMHSVMQSTLTRAMASELPLWFIEGSAQLAGGGYTTGWNDNLTRLVGSLSGASDTSNDSAIGTYLTSDTVDARPYGHGYLAAAYMGYLANGGTGEVTGESIANGINKIFQALRNGDSFVDAVQNNTGKTVDEIKTAINTADPDAVSFVRQISYNSYGGAGSVLNNTSLNASPYISLAGYSSKPIAAKNIFLQVGSEAGQHIDVSLFSIGTKSLGIFSSSVATQQKAENAIDEVKNAIQKISHIRSYYGAIQNRLEHTVDNLDNVVENTTASESAIRDTDMATEAVNMNLKNILSQAGISMMSQANQSNQGVLSLLQ